MDFLRFTRKVDTLRRLGRRIVKSRSEESEILHPVVFILFNRKVSNTIGVHIVKPIRKSRFVPSSLKGGIEL